MRQDETTFGFRTEKRKNMKEIKTAKDEELIDRLREVPQEVRPVLRHEITVNAVNLNLKVGLVNVPSYVMFLFKDPFTQDDALPESNLAW